MIKRFISSKQVVAKIFADLDLKEGPNRISDIYEWIGEAVEKIGAVGQLVRKVSGVNGEPIIPIKNNQARIPNDLFRVNQVLYSHLENGPWLPMVTSSGSINAWDPDSEQIPASNVTYVNSPVSMKLQYMFKPGYINTSPSTGYLKLVYDALPIDEDGYPLVPDLMSYTEAIYWYVAMKLAYPEYRNGRMRQDIYYDAKRSWNFYCKQAYAEAMMPNEDEMEAIKNNWVRLVPNMRAHSYMYEDLNEQELIYKQK